MRKEKQMFRKFAVVLVVVSFVFASSFCMAGDDSELILKVLVKKGIITQAEVDEMRAEIAKEKPAAKAEAKAGAPKTMEDRIEAVEKDLASKVGLDKAASKLKIKGRWAAGYYDSEKAGSYPNGSFQAPEAKIQFTFKPDDINDIIMRLSLNNAAFNSVDYFYLDTNLMKLTPWEKTAPFTLASRIGRFKIDFGEETFSNNPVESALPSNSAANVSGNDEGIMLFGKIGKVRPLSWSVGVFNGNTGTGADNNWVKSFNGKVAYNIIDPLYVSASYYTSGNLDQQASEMSIAGLTTVPSSALQWTRQIAEVDVRYDFKKGKIQNPPAYCDSLAYIKGAYGYFIDNANPFRALNTVHIRDGNYGYVEGLLNVTKKLYAAGRASTIDLSGDEKTASLNSLTVNAYDRYSLGLGYRLSGATILKGEYSINIKRKGGIDDPKDDLMSFIVASQF